MSVVNPSGVPVYGPSAPYITPAMLLGFATGIAWNSWPARNSTDQQRYAAQLNVCARATGMVDLRLNMPVRATVNVETFRGPGTFEVQNDAAGVTKILTSRNLVTAVLGGRISASGAFPPSWTTIPADQFEPANSVGTAPGSTAPGAAGDGGQTIRLAPGWVNWWAGRESSRLEVRYVSGWPHASLSAAAAAAETTVAVDDITAWDGAVGVVYDDVQEAVTVSSVTPDVADAVTGPGTLTLTVGLSNPHEAGVLVSCLPANIQLATAYLASAEALQRGATATAVQAISGSSTGGGPQSAADYVKMAYDMIDNYGRVI